MSVQIERVPNLLLRALSAQICAENAWDSSGDIQDPEVFRKGVRRFTKDLSIDLLQIVVKESGQSRDKDNDLEQQSVAVLQDAIRDLIIFDEAYHVMEEVVIVC